MKITKIIYVLIILLTFTACSKDDEAPNNPPVLEDVELNVNEAIRFDSNATITTLEATDKDNDTLTYSIVSQTPTGSIAIEASTGKVTVANADAFVYQKDKKITATIKVSDGKSETTAQLVLNIIRSV